MNKLPQETVRDMSRWLMSDISEVPPERHADRVIADILRDLALKRAAVFPRIAEAFRISKDGNPRAQQRLADRIKAAGAMHVQLDPGKRGRYTMVIGELVGWNPETDKEIGLNDIPPEKPWLAVYLTVVQRGGRDIKNGPFFMLTHHSLSRCAQRFRLRTREDCEEVARSIWNGIINSGMSLEEMFNAPPAGHRIKVDDDFVAVMVPHEKRRQTMVCATVVWE